MKHRPGISILILLQLLALVFSTRATDFFVDSERGSDTNNGTASKRAWKSLEPVNAHRFAPGDRLWFKASTRYTGQLKPQGSGAMMSGKPVTIQIGKYGRGSLPRIDGEGKTPGTLLLRNVEF